MSHDFADIDVLFIAGFGPITRSTSQSRDFYCQALGLPLKPMPGNEAYLLSEQDAIGGVKHFALWPLAQAAQSCFGQDQCRRRSRCRRHGLSLRSATLLRRRRGCSSRDTACSSRRATNRGDRRSPDCSVRKGCWPGSR